MGILDGFNDEQSQGLLAAAAQMLQQSGPSLRPTGIGQILGGGMSAYQGASVDARKRRLEEEQLKQAALLRGLQVQGLQDELADKDLSRQQDRDAQAFYAKFNLDRASQASPTAFAQSVLGSNLAPTVENAAALDSARQAQGGTPAAGGGTGGIFSQRLAQADAMRRTGNPKLIQRADELEKSALQFQPKVKSWEKVKVGGRILLKPYFEDGTAGEPVTADVAEKLSFQSTGGKTLGLNSYTGAQETSYTNTMTPGEIASNGVARDRLTFDKQQADRPTFNYDAGGFVSRPTAANPAGTLTPLLGMAAKPPTEFQGKSAAFGLRATEADKILTGLRDKGATGLGMVASDRPGALKGMVESVPWIGEGLGAGVNLLPSTLGGPNANQQRAEQAQRDFVNAVLRQESGAAISPAEFENARKQYFPQAGDTDEVIAQKATNRQLAIQGFDNNAGRSKMTAPAKTSAGGWSITKKD